MLNYLKRFSLTLPDSSFAWDPGDTLMSTCKMHHQIHGWAYTLGNYNLTKDDVDIRQPQ